MGLAQFGNWPPGSRFAGDAAIANVGGIVFQRGNMLLTAAKTATGTYQLDFNPTQLDVAPNPVNRLTTSHFVGGGGTAISAVVNLTGPRQMTVTVVDAAGAAVDGGFYIQFFG